MRAILVAFIFLVAAGLVTAQGCWSFYRSKINYKKDDFSMLNEYFLAKRVHSAQQIAKVAQKFLKEAQRESAKELAQQLVDLVNVSKQDICSDASSAVLSKLYESMIKNGCHPYDSDNWRLPVNGMVMTQLKDRAVKCVGQLYDELLINDDNSLDKARGLDILSKYFSYICRTNELWAGVICMLEKKDVALDSPMGLRKVFGALQLSIAVKQGIWGLVRYDETSRNSVTSRQIVKDYLEEYLFKPCKLVTTSPQARHLEKIVEILSSIELAAEAHRLKPISGITILWIHRFLVCKRLLNSDQEILTEYMFTTTESNLRKEDAAFESYTINTQLV